jgi:hypothetical protein
LSIIYADSIFKTLAIPHHFVNDTCALPRALQIYAQGCASHNPSLAIFLEIFPGPLPCVPGRIDTSTEPVRLPPRSPNLNAFAERSRQNHR